MLFKIAMPVLSSYLLIILTKINFRTVIKFQNKNNKIPILFLQNNAIVPICFNKIGTILQI